jgi:hypothetical protein
MMHVKGGPPPGTSCDSTTTVSPPVPHWLEFF